MVEEREVNDKYEVESVRCRWLPGEEGKVRFAEVIRVIQVIDWWYADNSPSAANVKWQPGVLWKVKEFVNCTAPTAKVIVSPAGMVTADMETCPCPSVAELGDHLGKPRGGLRGVLLELERLGCLEHEMLLGMDECQGKTWPLQTVVHVARQPEVSLCTTTVKLYPGKDEKASLLGWQICKNQQGVPAELA